MKQTIKAHLSYYLSLTAILLLCFSLIVLTSSLPHIQMIAIMMTAFFYVVWGIIHHVIHHDTTARVVVEYILIGTLGIVLALLLIR